MNIKASGRSALIIAAGFWLCVSGPLQAAEDADGGVTASKAESPAGAPVALNKFARKFRKHVSSHRKSVKVASKASPRSGRVLENKVLEKKKAVEAAAVFKDDDSPSALPPSIANANAQLVAADVPADDANSASTKAGNILRVMAAKQGDAAEPQATAPATDTDVVAADQLNDVDRALSESRNEDKPAEDKPALTPTVAMAMAQAPAAVSSSESTWDQTSLIGKIFIAFGGLLTLASAARMFMA